MFQVLVCFNLKMLVCDIGAVFAPLQTKVESRLFICGQFTADLLHHTLHVEQSHKQRLSRSLLFPLWTNLCAERWRKAREATLLRVYDTDLLIVPSMAWTMSLVMYVSTMLSLSGLPVNTSSEDQKSMWWTQLSPSDHFSLTFALQPRVSWLWWMFFCFYKWNMIRALYMFYFENWPNSVWLPIWLDPLRAERGGFRHQEPRRVFSTEQSRKLLLGHVWSVPQRIRRNHRSCLQ